jgi:predicted dithiol-disulfide oxidoreductase (DUF899 family)
MGNTSVTKVSDEQWIAAKEELISQQNALTKQMEKVGTLFAALPENHNSSSETDTE